MKFNAETYPTSDLAEIVYLLTKGVSLVRAERQPQSERVIFYFQGRDACQRLVADIAYGRDLVSLSSALEQVRRARHLMHRV